MKMCKQILQKVNARTEFKFLQNQRRPIATPAIALRLLTFKNLKGQIALKSRRPSIQKSM